MLLELSTAQNEASSFIAVGWRKLKTHSNIRERKTARATAVTPYLVFVFLAIILSNAQVERAGIRDLEDAHAVNHVAFLTR